MDRETLRVGLATGAVGAFVGAFCAHFGFTPIEHWACVISAGVFVGLVI